jgi:hypothetical protein
MFAILTLFWKYCKEMKKNATFLQEVLLCVIVVRKNTKIDIYIVKKNPLQNGQSCMTIH